MTTATRCCSCGDEVAVGSDVWRGAHEGETACSALCRYRSLVEATRGWSASMDAERAAGLVRVRALREALLHDPEVFGENAIDVCVRGGGDPAWELTIPLAVTEEVIRLEIVAGEWCGDDFTVPWGGLLDAVVRDA